MKNIRSYCILNLFIFLLPFSSFALSPGENAPAFSAHASDGKGVSLGEYQGKIVVLEWKNHECPFVKKHYNSHNMQKLQEDYTKKGVIWLSVISSAPGKQGYSTPEQAEKDRAYYGSHATAILLDPEGKLGKLYGAQSTPHMFVINGKGKLVYAGAIDNKPSTDVDDVKTAKNYVSAALDEVIAGKPVSNPMTKSYGCGVKYE